MKIESKIIYKQKPKISNIDTNSFDDFEENVFIKKLIQNRVTEDIDIVKFFTPEFKDIQKPIELNYNDSLTNAIKLIESHINSDKIIGFYCDYDVDGTTSLALLYKTFKNIIGYNNFKIIFPNRFDGYGITDNITNKIIENDIDLLITADLGISDYKNINILKENNIEVIVTDHHELPKVLPDCICINPKLGNYDKDICGCTTIWLLLVELTHSEDMYNYLDLVGIATIADMVSLKSITNRFFINTGLEIINKNKKRYNLKTKIDEQDIKFNIAPMINSDSRLNGINKLAFKYLISNENNSEYNYNELENINKKRKKLELINTRQIEETKPQDNILIEYRLDMHTGIQGIIANKLSIKYNAVVIIFSKQKNKLLGSARSNDIINLKDKLDLFQDKYNRLISYGGHKSAAGLTIDITDFEFFKKKFIELIKEETIKNELTKYYDFEYNSPTLDDYKNLKNIAPFGQGFEEPLFYGNMYLNSMTIMGIDRNHTKLIFKDPKSQKRKIEAVMFYNTYIHNYLSKKINSNLKFTYQLSLNNYKGRKKLQLIIQDVIEDDNE